MNFYTYLPIYCTFFLLCGMILSCSTPKGASSENYSLQITLVDGEFGKYIMNEYAAYSPSEVKKSNKTINQYMAIFKCTTKEYDALQISLTKDPIVLDYKNLNIISNKTKVTSGKSEKHAKTKSIRDKN